MEGEPYGKITLIPGDPGDGKTTFVLAVAALLTNGKPLPESEDTGRSGGTLPLKRK